jgi:hypothetical protein
LPGKRDVVMRRVLIITCLVAVAAAFSCSEDDDDWGSSSSPLVRGPLSEMVGLASHLSTGSSEAEQASRTYELTMDHMAGIKYLRRDFHWHRIEPSRGNFDYSEYDTIVTEAEAWGIKFIGLLCFGAPWAATGSGGDIMYPPDDPADFANFAYTTVDRYKDHIHSWEIWNEQNSQRFWKPEVDPEGYGFLLKAAATAIYAADPKAKVAFGGMATIYDASWDNMWGFLEEVYAFHPDIGNYFDILAIHTYTFIQIADPETDDPGNRLWQSVPTMIKDARDILMRWEGREKPIWITEVGWHTAVNDPLDYSTEEEQAQYLVRSFILSVAYGATRYCWYTFRDSSDYLNDSEAAFGLVGYDPDPTDDVLPYVKPAYYAYATLASVLGDTYYSEDMRLELGLADTQYAYRFITPGGAKRVTVPWTMEDDLSVILLQPGPDMNTFTQVDMLGNSRPLTQSQGFLPCIVNNSPIYVVEEK